MAETIILWHYTFLPHLKSILRDGLIKPATALVKPPERPIVWFSKNQFWERTVTKGMKFRDGRLIELDFNAMIERPLFPVRIGVLPETAPFDWLSLRKMSRMRPEMADGLVRVAEELGADPRDWRGTFEPVAMKEWVDLQVFKSDVWVTPPCFVGAFGVVSLRPSHPHYVAEKAWPSLPLFSAKPRASRPEGFHQFFHFIASVESDGESDAPVCESHPPHTLGKADSTAISLPKGVGDGWGVSEAVEAFVATLASDVLQAVAHLVKRQVRKLPAICHY